MQRYDIEDETWFQAARTGLERRAFKLRLQPRSIIIEKDGRLPRIVGSARELLEFAERQGLAVGQAAYEAADAYGDGKAGRPAGEEQPFQRPRPGAAAAPAPLPDPLGRPQTSAAEIRLAELRLEQERLSAERRASAQSGDEKRELLARCAALEGELAGARAAAAEAGTQRDLYQMSAKAAEDRVRAMQAELDGPADNRGPDKKFNQLRRYLARELHPDLAGEDAAERKLREAIFKRVWAKIEQLQ